MRRPPATTPQRLPIPLRLSSDFSALKLAGLATWGMPPIQPVSRATRGIRDRSGLWRGGKRRAGRCFGFGIGVRGNVRNRCGGQTFLAQAVVWHHQRVTISSNTFGRSGILVLVASEQRQTPCRGKTRRLLSQHNGRIDSNERDRSPLWCFTAVGRCGLRRCYRRRSRQCA